MKGQRVGVLDAGGFSCHPAHVTCGCVVLSRFVLSLHSADDRNSLISPKDPKQINEASTQPKHSGSLDADWPPAHSSPVGVFGCNLLT